MSPPPPPTSSAPNRTTRIVRRGRPGLHDPVRGGDGDRDAGAHCRPRRCRGPSCRDGRRSRSRRRSGRCPAPRRRRCRTGGGRCCAGSGSGASAPAGRARQDALQLLGVGDGQSAPAGIGRAPSAEALHAGMRVAVMVGADRADDDRRPRPCGWRRSGPGGAARRTGRSPSRPGSACIVWSMKTILPRTAASGAACSAATLSKPITSASMPRGRGRAAIAERGDHQRAAGRARRSRPAPRRAPRPACRTARRGRWRSRARSAAAPPSRAPAPRPRCRPGAGRPRW